MFAIVATGGKQYLVEAGQKLKVESLAGEKGATIVLDKVLLITDGKKAGTKLGNPYISGATVEAKILAQGLGDKVRISKKKPKARYQIERGHRQPYTQLEIIKIA
jgi:large subunit ribosomal protein L21